jgi:hypothetical protein
MEMTCWPETLSDCGVATLKTELFIVQQMFTDVLEEHLASASRSEAEQRTS